MTAIHVPHLQQCRGARRENFFEMNTLRAGQAVSLRGRRPMQLRLLDGSGSAWVTRTGSSSTASPPEDLILVAGQTLHLAPREHWVMEPAAAQAVRYQWK